jgi:hypothetical protein
MLGLSRAVVFFTDIIAHELELFGEDETILQTQGAMISQTDAKLTLHIFEGRVKVDAMTDNVIDNDASVSVFVDLNPRQ